MTFSECIEKTERAIRSIRLLVQSLFHSASPATSGVHANMPKDERGQTQRRKRGFTLFELLVTLAILAVLSSIAFGLYSGYMKTVKISEAVKHIYAMSLVIDNYKEDYKHYPESLDDVGLGTMKDPWGNPYHYLNITTAKGVGMVRKDHSLVPLNTDYDLYSSGEDGLSVPPLTAKASRDDIVRANNGKFVGLGGDY